jgi:hypothetical protein
MPKLNNFRDFIASIPIGRHSEEVKSDFWHSDFHAAQQSQVHTNIFSSNPTARISREKILATSNGPEKCALVLLWGYTTGMRGNQHRKFLKNLKSISEVCSFNPKSWEDFYKDLKQLGGLGISTITKLAYFHGLKFNNNPALILDQRIINILAKEHWEELKNLSHIKYSNADRKYVEYLEKMKLIASNLKIDEAQLEFFLFGMGNVFD